MNKARALKRARRRAAGCLSKTYYATIEEAARSLGPGRAVRTCYYCDGYHITSRTRTSLVVLVGRP